MQIAIFDLSIWFAEHVDEDLKSVKEEELNMHGEEGRDSNETKKEEGEREKVKSDKTPFDIDLDLGLRSSDTDDSNYSDDGVNSYYIANVKKAKKAKRERDALREENSKLKMENGRLAQKNGELMDTFRMASVMGCFENLDNDAKPKLSK